MTDIILTVVAIFVIAVGTKNIVLSWYIGIYNLIIIGLIICFLLILVYIHASYIIDFIINRLYFVIPQTSNPYLVIDIIAFSLASLCIVLAGISMKLSWLSEKYNKHIKLFNYNEALKVAKKRLNFLYTFYGAHALTSAALIRLARFYEELGQNEKVEALYLEALSIFSKGLILNTNSKLSLELRANLNISLSKFYLSESCPDEARRCCEEAIRLSRIKKVNSIYMAMSQESMALIYSFSGHHAKTIAEFTKSRKTYARIIDKYNFSKPNLFLANTFYLEYFPISIIAFAGILPILFSSLRTQDYLICLIVFFIVVVLFNSIIHKYISYQKVIYRSLLGYCSLLEDEGYFYQQLGDITIAEQKLVEIFEKLSLVRINDTDRELTIARNHLNRASLQVNKGMHSANSPKERLEHYKNAIHDFDNALKIYTSIFDFTSPYVPLEHRSKFIYSMLERNLIYAQLVGIEIHEDELYKTFADIKKQLISPDQHRLYAIFLVKLGNLLYLANKYTQAETQYIYADEIYSKLLSCNSSEISGLDLSRAYLAVTTGRVTVALEYFRRSIVIANTVLLECLAVVSEKHKIAAVQRNLFSVNSYATFINKFYASSQELIGELADFILQSKSLVCEALSTQKNIIMDNQLLHNYPDALQAKSTKLSELRRAIAHKTLVRTSSNDFEILERLKSEKERLEEELAREIPELELEKKLRTVNRHAICKKLPNNSVLIEIILVDLIEFIPKSLYNFSNPHSHYFAFIFRSGEPCDIKLIDLGNAEDIDKLILGFRLEILNITNKSHDANGNRKATVVQDQKSVSNKDVEDSGVVLRKIIFDPLSSYFDGRKRLFISPDGNLTQIPFEVLPLDNGKQLIDTYTISYLSSGRDILRFGFTPSSAPDTSLVIADPDFNYAAGSNFHQDRVVIEEETKKLRSFDLGDTYFERLKGTHEEGEAITNLLNGNAWIGEEAVKRNVFESMQSPLVLHIATHGVFIQSQTRSKNFMKMINEISSNYCISIENPMLCSFLALAGANWKTRSFIPHPNAGNGILTAEEICTLNLASSELVVLSACETGSGEVLVGEGVFGLRRAFILAGAKTLVMSLWQVPDSQTRDLMIDFYNRLMNGESRVDSLRNSQLYIREKYPNAYFWGAFICQGDPSSISILLNSSNDSMP